MSSPTLKVVVSALGLLAAMPVGVALPRAPERSTDNCETAGLIEKNDSALIRRGRPTKGQTELIGCLFEEGEDHAKSLGSDMAGAEDLNHTIVGSITPVCESLDDDAACPLHVAVRDLADADRYAFYPIGPTDRFRRVGSVRVNAKLGAAWIACRGGPANEYYAKRSPNCLGPGKSKNVVFAVDSGHDFDQRRRLDAGRRIDPTSLQLSHGRLSWRHGPKRRHARLK